MLSYPNKFIARFFNAASPPRDSRQSSPTDRMPNTKKMATRRHQCFTPQGLTQAWET